MPRDLHGLVIFLLSYCDDGKKVATDTMLPTTRIRLEMNNRDATTTTTTITTDTTIQLYSPRLRLTTFIIGYIVGMLFLANVGQVAFGVYVPIHCSSEMNQYVCVFNGKNLCTRMAMSAVVGVLTLIGLVILTCTGAKGLSILLAVLVTGQLGMGLFVVLQDDIKGFTSKVSDEINSHISSCHQKTMSSEENKCWKNVLKDFSQCKEYHAKHCPASSQFLQEDQKSADSPVKASLRQGVTAYDSNNLRKMKNSSYFQALQVSVNNTDHLRREMTEKPVSLQDCSAAFKSFVRSVYSNFKDLAGPVMLSMAGFHVFCAVVLVTASSLQHRERKRLRKLEIHYEQLSLSFD